MALAALLIAGPALAQAPTLRSAEGDPARPAASMTSTTSPGQAPRPTAPGAEAPFRPEAAIPAAPLPLASSGLVGGGDAAPLCRAECTSTFYVCASAGGDAACHAALATCRRGCEDAAPPVGRLQSPLPGAGLAPAGALRALPGALPPPR